MRLFYRVVVFGEIKGPWRPSKRLARMDAIELGVGEFDEWGKFFVDATAEIEWKHEYEFMRSGEAHPASCRTIPAQVPQSVLRRA